MCGGVNDKLLSEETADQCIGKMKGCDHDQTTRLAVSIRSPKIDGRVAVSRLQLQPGLVFWLQI